VSLDPDDSPRSTAQPPREWADAAPAFAEAVRRYQLSHGRRADDAAVVSTVRTNSELVPQRAQNLLTLLERLAGRASLKDQRVLELGCGFGGLAAYLALAGGPRELVAVDVRPDFVATARESASRLELGDRLRYLHADMRALPGADTGRYDVAIANNSFIYLASSADMQRALRELARVLAPGGHVLFFHANRWTPREPFTGAPLVHLLPAPLVRPVARVTGWQHNQGRVRLVSTIELRLRALAAGFREVRTGGFRPDGRVTSHAALLRFYGLAARRPPH
jgi:SAM-dependent methyltransferase